MDYGYGIAKGVAIVGSAAIGGVSTRYPPAAAAAGAAVGIALSSIMPDPETQNFTNDWSTWAGAVQKTQASPSSLDEYVSPRSLLTNYTPDPNNQLNDPVWNSCRMAVNRIVTYQNKFWEGDGYDVHGYAGCSVGQCSTPATHEFVFYYSQGTQVYDY